MTAHMIRRTFIREGLNSGLPRHVIMEMSGHSTEKEFNKYFSVIESERESWVGNLEQEFAPLYRIYLRGINYNPKLITRESMNDFNDALYKCLRKEAANNTNNFIFSDTDFNNFTNKCPIHIKKESIENIKLQQINERYDSTILGCPAVFSKVDIKYKYGQLLKDIFYWQIDLYKEILLIID